MVAHLCLFCVGNDTLSASQRLAQFPRRQQYLIHTAAHIKRSPAWPRICPHPLCQEAIDKPQGFWEHAYKAAYIGADRATEADPALAGSDDSADEGSRDDQPVDPADGDSDPSSARLSSCLESDKDLCGDLKVASNVPMADECIESPLSDNGPSSEASWLDRLLAAAHPADIVAPGPLAKQMNLTTSLEATQLEQESTETGTAFATHSETPETSAVMAPTKVVASAPSSRSDFADRPLESTRRYQTIPGVCEVELTSAITLQQDAPTTVEPPARTIHSCPECQRVCKSAHYLRVHRQTHQPHVCKADGCDAHCSSAKDLVRHMAKRHGISAWTCDLPSKKGAREVCGKASHNSSFTSISLATENHVHAPAPVGIMDQTFILMNLNRAWRSPLHATHSFELRALILSLRESTLSTTGSTFALNGP
ncbi:hypothetical protein LTR82_017448 [Friedmanniomyces endolithicus]|uniref:C2H2-type domain-containing protein n=1 Tax=Friedmanniomyces endolithicus TaxID=329885 RepID=A0AAN6IZG0_9PEZI|nr:hypothetical protein LTR82_017448 [Friedmanniomyces endolithicus]